MCFGNETETGKTINATTTTPSPYLSNAANQNLANISNLENRGYQMYPHGGQAAIAPFGQLQGKSFDLAGWLGGSGGPYSGEAKDLIGSYSGAPAGSVSSDTIANNMSPYMNAYVAQALAPQIEAQNQQFNTQNRGFDAQATGAGAYGDTGWGLGKTNLTNQQNIARMGLIGNAYNSAFNTAIGAGAQDVSNSMNAQNLSAMLREQMLQRQLGGEGALLGLGNYQEGSTSWLNSLGQQQTAQDQARRSFDVSQFDTAHNQWPLQTAQLANQTLQASTNAYPTTTTGNKTTYAPDNSGYQAIGAAVGAFLSDERAKENIKQIGATPEGLPIKVFNYLGDDTRRIGLMAQDVEKIHPEAVLETPSGLKMVNYDLALGGAFGLQ